jgi:hypothetical protein
MAISRRRLALGGGALVVLSALGVGFVQANSIGPSSALAAVDAAVTAPALAVAADGADAFLAAPRLRGRRLVVHGTLTIDSPKNGLITIQIDGGTIAGVDANSITIAEKGGASVTVAIDNNTRVRRDRKRATAADLKVGETVRVVSRVADGGAATAKAIIVAPAP